MPGLALFQFNRLGLSAVPIRDKGLKRPLLMVKRRGQTLSVAAQALLEMIALNRPSHVLPDADKLAGDLKTKQLPAPRAARNKPAKTSP